MFKVPPRLSEVQQLRAEVAKYRAEVAELSRQFATMPRPDRAGWERKAAPDLLPTGDIPTVRRLQSFDLAH